ncbi:MAG: hypothetical protein A3K22_05415 [Deltaproteobacteria bacterium RBG_16_42_7]|nr:MAG: hypothetical protein A3K22_05415 [Deltaproteobacteria bacterium RBG_16_42_7]
MHPYITIAALYSIFVAFKKKDLKYLIVGYLVFFVILLQIRRIRYIMVIFPMVALMASYGLQGIKDKGLRRFVVASAVISSLIVAIFVYLPFLDKISAVNLKKAGMFLNSIDIANAEVFTISLEHDDVNQAVSVPILDLFTEKNIFYFYDEWVLPPSNKYKESPLRFTWEYKNPAYYSLVNNLNKKNQALVFISSDPGKIPLYYEKRIKGFLMKKVFNVSEGVFNYKTFITIYYRSK